MWKNKYLLGLLDAKFGDYLGRKEPADEMEEGKGEGGAEMTDKAGEGDSPGLTRTLSMTGSIYVSLAAQRFKSSIATDGEKRAKDLSPGELRLIRQQTDKVTWFHHHLHSTSAENEGEKNDDDADPNPFVMPEEWKKRPMWVLSLPWYAVLTCTVPPCHTKAWEKWYFASFLISIGYIGVISHFMVEWCARIGCLLKIPAVVMGTTVLAAGTSIPDALSSISVARDGFADMAVANAVGSNVFDIWLGLGLPWFLYLSWQSPSYIIVSTKELVPSVLILLGVLVLYIGTVMARGFTISKKMGYVYVSMYGLYALYNIFLVWVLDVYHI